MVFLFWYAYHTETRNMHRYIKTNPNNLFQNRSRATHTQKGLSISNITVLQHRNSWIGFIFQWITTEIVICIDMRERDSYYIEWKNAHVVTTLVALLLDQELIFGWKCVKVEQHRFQCVMVWCVSMRSTFTHQTRYENRFYVLFSETLILKRNRNRFWPQIFSAGVCIRVCLLYVLARLFFS